VTALGRIRANSPFSIAKEREPPRAPPAPAAGLGTMDFLGMMLAQQSEARRDAQAAADRQMTMITGLATAIVPALLQRPAATAPGTSVADTLALVAAMQNGKGGGLKDTLEAMAAFKALMGDAGGGSGGGDDGGPDLDLGDLAGSAARLAGPAMKALGDYLQRQRPGQVDPAAPNPNPAGPPPIGHGDHLALGSPEPSRYRLIELVRVDVVYGFERGHDAEKIADLVYDVIEDNNVTEAEINVLAVTFALSPTGLEDLAREGIDLRARPQWAADFFAALAAIHSEQAANLGGAGGGETDIEGNGETGARGEGQSTG
jgi:hypothetical protein